MLFPMWPIWYCDGSPFGAKVGDRAVVVVVMGIGGEDCWNDARDGVRAEEVEDVP